MAEYPVSNRELSWIEFNARVLEEAFRKDTPLLERLKFLDIVSTNFNEFFMVRVAGLKAASKLGDLTTDPTGMTPRKILEEVSTSVREILGRHYACLTAEVLPGLADAGLEIVAPGQWTATERYYLEKYFSEYVFPLVTPLRIEKDAFPSMGNLRLHCGFELQDEGGGTLYAIVQVPQNMGRFIRLPRKDDPDGAYLKAIRRVVLAK